MLSKKDKSSTMVAFALTALFMQAAIGSVHALNGDLNLPSTIVRIEVFDGTESYFLTKLLDVPEGYDVINGTYLGWCIDTRAEMTRSPATHPVMLYSSLNPPSGLANQNWDMVNYILNHKPENVTADDIQQAIWRFIHIDGNYTPTSQTAWNIINDALKNGEGFIPKHGQIVAVICYPVVLLPHPSEVQISIIEVVRRAPQETPSEVEPQDGNEQPKQSIEAWILAIIIITLLTIITLLFTLVLHRRKWKRIARRA